MKRKKPLLIILTIAIPLLAACGNDPDVEARFVQALENGIQLLDSTTTVAELVAAEDTFDQAFRIEGIDELRETGIVKDVQQRYEKALDKARERIMKQLEEQLTDDGDLEL